MSSGFCLNERDYEALRFIDRYGIATLKTLQMQPFFEGCGVHGAKNMLRRLGGKGGLLRSRPLRAQSRFYHLTSAGYRTLEAKGDETSPVSSATYRGIGLIRAYAMLCFCRMREPRQDRFTPGSFRKQYGELYRRGEMLSYYLDIESGTPKLGYLRVDHGHSYLAFDRVIQRIISDIQRRRDNAAFHELINAGLFVYTLLVATEAKAQRVRTLIDERGIDPAVTIRTVVMPELLAFVCPVPE